MEYVLWSTCCGVRVVEYLLWSMCCGVRAVEYVLWSTCCGVRVVEYVLWNTYNDMRKSCIVQNTHQRTTDHMVERNLPISKYKTKVN